MQTQNDFVSALTTDFTVEVISSNDLISDIYRKQALRQRGLSRRGRHPVPSKTVLATVPPFDPSKTITIKPIFLLHSIGRITTPPVPNFASLSATWAVIRYLWAFDTDGTTHSQPLHLSRIARDLDFHQKAVLSDEVGMGMAWYIMTGYLGTTEAIDVSIALETPSWSMFQQFPASPDYLFFDDPSKNTYVVECKGNQSSYDSALHQLQRGTEQVPSIVFTDGRRSTSLVIATCMYEDFTEVFIIDPPNNSSDSDDAKRDEYAEKTGTTEWTVKDNTSFSMDSRLLGRAKILNYAGFEMEALSQLPKRIQQRYERRVRGSVAGNTFETPHGNFVGVTETFETLSDYIIRFSKGLLQDSYARFRSQQNIAGTGEEAGASQVSPTPEFISSFGESGFLVNKIDTRVEVGFQSICRDGTLMQLTIQK